MMRFSNEKIPNWREIPVYPLDRVLEVISLFILASIWIFYFLLRSKTPDMIPTHFDALGNPNGWSSSKMLYMLPTIATFIMILLSASAYFVKFVNVPVVINPKTSIVQFSLIARMMRWLTITIGFLFFIINMMQYTTVINVNSKSLSILLWIDMAILFIISIFYVIKINSIGKRASSQE